MSEAAEGLTDEIRSFLKEVSGVYRGMKSYRDHGRAVIVQQIGKVKTTTEAPVLLTFSRPNRLRLDAGQYDVACDGVKLFFAVPSSKQYTATTAPDAIDRRKLPAGSVMGGIEEGHPEILDLLTRGDAVEVLLSSIKKINWRPDAKIGDVPCRVLAWETAQTRLTLYFDARRKVLLRAEGESSPASDPEQNSTVDSIRLTYDYAPVELDIEPGAEVFAWKPPAGFRQMKEIGGEPVKAEAPQHPDGSHLLGKPLAALTGTDLMGKPLKADEYKDRALLLFFWSANGSENSLTSIPLIQALADKYKDRKDFAVLAVNTDQSPKPLAPQILERKKATFRCLTDESMALRKLFHLEGVPTFILADRSGVIRLARLGAPPTLKTELETEIARLLGD